MSLRVKVANKDLASLCDSSSGCSPDSRNWERIFGKTLKLRILACIMKPLEPIECLSILHSDEPNYFIGNALDKRVSKVEVAVHRTVTASPKTRSGRENIFRLFLSPLHVIITIHIL